MWLEESPSVGAVKDLEHAIAAIKLALRMTHHAERTELRDELAFEVERHASESSPKEGTD